jgi:hypothetical protein
MINSRIIFLRQDSFVYVGNNSNTSNFDVLYLNASLPSMTDAPAPSFFVTVQEQLPY